MGVKASKGLFLGKLYDSSNAVTNEKFYYNPADLNTHCIITGMTGSGKTGLGIDMLEEIAKQEIPAIILDPKGDLTNLLLHFKGMTGEDIAPWLDPEAPAREGKDLATYAEEKAEEWIEGQNKWGYTDDDIETLSKVDYTVFTPGSKIGNPINIMSTFAAPEFANQTDEEKQREEIATSVTALLGLLGYNNIDPLTSREHILLSNIIEFYWSMNKSVSLVDLIKAVNEPPFDTLGALSIDQIYPQKDRFALALQINNFLASPTFSAWSEGPTLDINNIIAGNNGKPRFSIFYMQHLSNQEKMFFVTMLYSQIESWMRMQTGTGNLRLAVYFDEMAGFVPPTSNPSSKTVIMRLLKQARAYGVGLILSTQNPVDIDYKGLSNAGTWFIGRLQTEQDKNRLLDGLTTTDGQINRSAADKLISALKKRAFLYMNVHDSGLKVMTTRWTLNYLAGPLTRNLIPELYERGLCTELAADGKEVKAKNTFTPIEAAPSVIRDEEETESGKRPAVPASINEYFMAPTQDTGDSPITYRPAWVAQAEMNLVKDKYNFSLTKKKAALIEEESLRGRTVRWDDYTCVPWDTDAFSTAPCTDDATYEELPVWMTDAKTAKAFETDFVNYVYRDGSVQISANEKLGVYSDEDDTEEEFLQKCKDKIEEMVNKDVEKLSSTYQRALDKLDTKLEKAQLVVDEKNSQKKQKMVQTGAAVVELAVSLFGGRRRSVMSSLNKGSQTINSKRAVEKAEIELDAINDEITAMKEEMEEKIAEIRERWEGVLDLNKKVQISVYKKDIFVDLFGICWFPYYTDEDGKLRKAY